MKKQSKNLGMIATWLLRVTIFLIPFYFLRFSILGIPTNIFETFVLLSFLSTFYVLRSTNNKKIVSGPVWPYLFLAIALISAFIADDKADALGIFKGWFLVPVVLYWVVINLAPFVIPDLIRNPGIRIQTSGSRLSRLQAGMTEREPITNSIVLPLALSGLIVSLWAILQHYGVVGLLFYQKADPASFMQYLEQGRAFGPFESPNYLAMFLVPVILLSLSIIPNLSRLRVFKIILLPLYLLPVFAIYFSGSRGGIAALLFGAVVYLFVILSGVVLERRIPTQKDSSLHPSAADSIQNDGPFKVGAVIAAIGVIIVFINAIYFAAGDRFMDNLRLDIYQYSWRMVKDHWFWGIGLGGFYDQIKVLSTGNGSFQVHGLPYALHPHNLFLAIWLNLGFLGLITFIGIIGRSLYKAIKNGNAAAIALLAILIHGLFDTVYFKNDLSALFWLIMALIYMPTKHETTSQ